MDKQTIELNEHVSIIIESLEEEYPEDLLEYLGKFGDEAQEWCIDRQQGWLLGEAVPEPEWSERQEELEDKMYESRTEVNYITDEEYEELEKLRDEYDKAYDLWEEYHGLELLDSTLKSTQAWHEPRYFYPYIENYQDCTKEEKIKYAIQDWKLMEDYGNYWWYIYYKISLVVDDWHIDYLCSGTIDSSSERCGKEELWEETISNLFSNYEEYKPEDIKELIKEIDL